MIRLFQKRKFLVFSSFILLVVFVMPGKAFPEPLNFSLADDYVEITGGFTGSDLVVFGDREGDGEVVVVIEGPAHDSVVRRKERTFGAWVNRSSLRFKGTASYYDYALSVDSESEILSLDLQKERRLGLLALKFAPHKDRYDEEVTVLFQDALLRNQQQNNLYPIKPQKVLFLGEHLFRADFHLPSNVPSGEYKVRALLVNDGQIVYEQTKELQVGLTGFSSNVHKFSINHSFLYGFLCVLIACFAGWLSNFLVQRN